MNYLSGINYCAECGKECNLQRFVQLKPDGIRYPCCSDACAAAFFFQPVSKEVLQ